MRLLIHCKSFFKKSLSRGIVPDDFKIAKVVPIYKKDNPKIFDTYRPVSVLPCFQRSLNVYRIILHMNFYLRTTYYIKSNIDFVLTIQLIWQ